MKDILDALKAAFVEERLSQNDVAFMADIHSGRMSTIMIGKHESKISTLRHIAAAIGYRIDFTVVKDADAQAKMAEMGVRKVVQMKAKEARIRERVAKSRDEAGYVAPENKVSPVVRPAPIAAPEPSSFPVDLLNAWIEAGRAYKRTPSKENEAEFMAAKEALENAGCEEHEGQWVMREVRS